MSGSSARKANDACPSLPGAGGAPPAPPPPPWLGLKDLSSAGTAEESSTAPAPVARTAPAPAETEAAASSCSGTTLTPSSSTDVTVSVKLPITPGSCVATMATYGSALRRSGSFSSSERRSFVLTLLFSTIPVNSFLRAGATASAFITHSPHRTWLAVSCRTTSTV